MTKAKEASELEEIKTFVDKAIKKALEKIFEENYPQKDFEHALALFLRESISRKVAETQEELEVLLASNDEEPLDACAVPDDQKEFFEIATPAVEAGILDPDYNIDWLHWNGNTLENVIKARAQVMHILEPEDYPALGKKIFDGILSAVREPTETIYFDGLMGWHK